MILPEIDLKACREETSLQLVGIQCPSQAAVLGKAPQPGNAGRIAGIEVTENDPATMPEDSPAFVQRTNGVLHQGKGALEDRSVKGLAAKRQIASASANDGK